MSSFIVRSTIFSISPLVPARAAAACASAVRVGSSLTMPASDCSVLSYSSRAPFIRSNSFFLKAMSSCMITSRMVTL